MKIEKGDRIVFRSPTRWSGYAKATRVVNGFDMDRAMAGMDDDEYDPTVRYGGHPHFIVKRHEVIDVLKPGHRPGPALLAKMLPILGDL